MHTAQLIPFAGHKIPKGVCTHTQTHAHAYTLLEPKIKYATPCGAEAALVKPCLHIIKISSDFFAVSQHWQH